LLVIIWFYSYVLILYLPTIYGTEWPIMCWCAVKKLLTHFYTATDTVTALANTEHVGNRQQDAMLPS